MPLWISGSFHYSRLLAHVRDATRFQILDSANIFTHSAILTALYLILIATQTGWVLPMSTRKKLREENSPFHTLSDRTEQSIWLRELLPEQSVTLCNAAYVSNILLITLISTLILKTFSCCINTF